jgi:hypothetical protein
MQLRYQILIEFLGKMASDVEHCKDFITGEKIPFDNVCIKKDDMWSVLVMENDNDADTIELLMLTCSSIVKLLIQKAKITSVMIFTLNTTKKYGKSYKSVK